MKPHSAPSAIAAQDRQLDRHAIAEGELTHDDRRQHHDGANRKVDTCGQHDQGLRSADNADDGHLLQDERQRKRREKARADNDRKDHQRQHQNDEGNGSRTGMKEMPDPFERTFLMGVEAGNSGFPLCHRAFEFLRRSRRLGVSVIM